MAKIPFDIKYKPQIESGEYKVETRDGRRVRIICWDKKSEKKYGYHIVALIEFGSQQEESTYFTIDGKGRLKDKEPELFIITPEPELSEFEKAVRVCAVDNLTTHIKDGNGAEMSCTVFIDDDTAKKMAAELLELAKKEFVKSGYVIEKKAFYDAVEKIDDKHKAEISVEYSLHCKIENGTRHAVMNWNEFQKVAQHFIDCGKAEALKDLPRWKKAKRDIRVVKKCIIEWKGNINISNVILKNSYYIPVSELEKLPGLKED